MCLALYIASDLKIPITAYNDRIPRFHVTELEKNDFLVKKQFCLPNVSYAGSNEGCGCGFFKDGLEGEELELAQENYYSLAHCVSALKFKGGKVALFACWEGDQGTMPKTREKLSVSELTSKAFEFKELAYYEIV
ncbi:hypothetical protein [Rheinheimera sp. MM224]|uniref:hypothetical protein n=1 Tax=Rheinheimera sp. MM224 TaxID=3019969 RepID=UPI0021F87EFE|nr:hypothetical protein [Rheinheimera sp. MM224]CAI3799814.1 hypothetical protein JAMGFMIE_02424 [Rheinheimera sp. MM224]